MKYNNLSEKILKIKNDFEIALNIFQNDDLFNKKELIYLKSDKNRLYKKWFDIKNTFKKLKKIDKILCKNPYLLGDFNCFLFKYYLVHLYYDNLFKLNKTFGIHEDFIRYQLDEKFKYNYNSIARYMYKFNFLYFLNYPKEFVLILKHNIDKNLYWIITDLKKQKNYNIEKRLFLDSINVFYHLKYIFLNIAYFFIKKIGCLFSNIKLKFRKFGLITEENHNKYLEIAKPGDIILTRSNWVLTNISIPGFWKHMSMYIGTGEYLKQNFGKNFKNFDLNKHYIIESVGGGVRIVNFKEICKYNDYLCAIRPNFSDNKKLRAIKLSLNNIGKKYDFLFNYHSDKSFVCSELITKSYLKEFDNDEGLTINLEKISLGITYPPNNLVKKLDNEQNKKNKELEFIIFIDSLEKEKKNFININKQDFYNSWKRSRLSINLK